MVINIYYEAICESLQPIVNELLEYEFPKKPRYSKVFNESEEKIYIDAFDESRMQYDAAYILNNIANAPRVIKIFVIHKDLYYPGYKFLYGAALNGKIIISDKRIYNNKNFKKELLHEIGHALGLKHCNRQCVMKPETSRKSIKDKSDDFCFLCRKKIEKMKKSY